MASVGVAVTGTMPRVCDFLVLPRRRLCAAVRAHHPAALPLGLRPGLLQDGSAVSGQAQALPIYTICSGWKQRRRDLGGIHHHMAFLGWGLQEAQLLSSLGPICKSKQRVDEAFQ